MKENEQDLAQQLFGGNQPSQSIGEAIGAFAKGAMEALGAAGEMALDAAYSQPMQHFVEHGAHELAAALFGNGHPFVMYPRAGKENSQEVGQSQENAQDHGMEHERGGRGR